MKKLLTIIFMLISTANLFSQNSVIKAGVNFNADIAGHKLGKLNYPSYELNFERCLANKFSFNLGYNFAKRNYTVNNESYYQTFIAVKNQRSWIHLDHSIILSGRYYLMTNKQGLFFEFGIPFTYSIEKDYYNGQKFYEHGLWAISTFAGAGIKYPFNSICGVEMNFNISPSFNFLGVDYGTSGFIKSGLRFVWTLDSKK